MKHILQESKRALGCQTTLTLVGKNKHQLEQYMHDLWSQIEDFDLRFSRFITFSELSNFNLNAGKKTTISPEFHKLLVVTKDYAINSKGLYNPFILPALQRAGYKGSWPNPDNVIAGLDFSKRRVAKPEEITIDQDSAHIPENTALDFGGIGKGYLLQQLADFIEPKVDGYWLSLGGDIVAAGKDHLGKNWVIGIEVAEGNSAIEEYMANVKRVAVATSGTTKRKGVHHHKVWHHLIDPVTGEPAMTDIATATVIGSDPVEADILASCLVLAGSKQVKQVMTRFDAQDVSSLNVILQLAVMTNNSRSLLRFNNKQTLSNS